MPGFLVVSTATVTCMHQGKATPGAPNPRVKAGGQPTVVQPPPWTIAGCALTGTNMPPCVTAQWAVAAARVFSNKQPLLLFDSTGMTTPPALKLLIQQTQARVKGT
jgi:hypothetical protein